MTTHNKETSVAGILTLTIVLIVSIGLSGVYMAILEVNSTPNGEHTVKYVQDGDTFKLYNGKWVRMARIDAPERGELGYKKAERFLVNAIANKTVKLDCENELGYYGRYICEVEYNMRNLNSEMLNKDLVKHYE